MPFDAFPAFNAELNRVMEKYRGKIRILKGFECEYHPRMLEAYAEYKKRHGYEILILGHHVDAARTLNNYFLSEPWQLSLYADEVCEALDTGLFDFLAHPDFVIYGYQKVDAPMLEAMNRIFTTCKKLDIPVELNAGGVRLRRGYPNREIWGLARDLDLTCIVGSDAHGVNDLGGWGEAHCEKFAAELGLRVIEVIEKL